MNKKIKIMFVIPTLGRSGAERVVVSLANNISPEEFSVDILLYRNDASAENHLLASLRENVFVSELGVRRRYIYSLHRIVLGIRRAVQARSPDIVIFCSGTSNAFLSMFLFLIRGSAAVIARESNLPSLYERRRLIMLLYRFFYKNYDKIVVQSQEMLAEFSHGFGLDPKKLHLINNPVDVGFISRKSIERVKVEAPDNLTHIVAFGRLTYQKGFDILIRAFSEMSEREMYFLSIYGEGEDRHALQSLAEELQVSDRVRILAPVDNPWGVMCKADLIVSSSRWEGFPNTVVEARALGRPVLANRYPGGLDEIMKRYGITVCEFSDNFQAGVERALHQPCKPPDTSEFGRDFRRYEGLFKEVYNDRISDSSNRYLAGLGGWVKDLLVTLSTKRN